MILFVQPANDTMCLEARLGTNIDEDIDALGSVSNVRFENLLKICIRYFGQARTNGSHFIFKMPWAGNPRINLQQVKGKAKPYQVHDVTRALRRLREEGHGS